MNTHEKYMQQCLDLAVKGLGNVAPNPMVGCVIVYEDKVIGEGYHQKYGEAHAEVNAINSVADQSLLEKSTLYVNLEPCSHHGKTPPCVDLIMERKVPSVVIGCSDPNPLVAGNGIEKLRSAGCKVESGILKKECERINKRFFTYHTKLRPYIVLKWAQTKDGFISSKFRVHSPKLEERVKNYSIDWISNETSRKLVHKWRSEEQAIMIGTNTALLDNPRLTAREWKGKNPVRVIIDKWLRIPIHYHIYDGLNPTIVFTGIKKESINNIDYALIDFDSDVLAQVMLYLYKKEILSVMVEGGEQIINTFIANNLWDEARVLIADKNFGKGIKAPDISGKNVISREDVDGDQLLLYENN
jgi:diaminohydroxyphosphoribosylaminopyrimidine deaminase/5-amino-6-(5-phosphoribosylamino)uracil reductase